MRRFVAIGGAAALVAALLPAPSAPAQDVRRLPDRERLIVRNMEFIPEGGATITWDEDPFTGSFLVTAHGEGMAIVEYTSPEAYLLGIREVPFTWEEEALQAQAVAARTYLAWTLQSGRSSTGRRYGYDICATDACQVYAGLPTGTDEQRWRAAVEATAGQILLHGGRPAQALYSSTSGGRTRSVQDVFSASGPVPYLTAVPSEDETSPFVEWQVWFDADILDDILGQAGLLAGSLVDVEVETRPDGTGPWQVVITSTAGRRTIGTWEFRTLMNRVARRLYPDRYPAPRPGGGRYPQVFLSPTYRIDRVAEPVVAPRPGEQPFRFSYVVTGNGWGHLVGMSQYGAQAMATSGATYDEILTHFYTGLVPESDPGFLPDQFVVGLGVGRERIAVGADGPLTVVVDGVPLASGIEGDWILRSELDRIEVEPPPGFDVGPDLAGAAIPATVEGIGTAVDRAVVEVSGNLALPGRIRVVVFESGMVVHRSGWLDVPAGPVLLEWETTADGPFAVAAEVDHGAGNRSVLDGIQVRYQVRDTSRLHLRGT